MSLDPSNPSADSKSTVANPVTRSVISYLLFIHFFFLLVGIKSNTASSGLDQDLRNRVPGLKQYLQLGMMDLNYMFHFTYYDGESNFLDTDYFVEADVPQADGTTTTVRLASFDLFPPVRSRRYERLAFRAGVFATSENENLASLLPHAMARRIMLVQNSRELTLRIRRRLLQNLMLAADDPRAATEKARSPDDPSYFQSVYEARAFMNDEGEVSIAQIKAASDTAAPSGTPARPAAPVPSETPSGTRPAPLAPLSTVPLSTAPLSTVPLSLPTAAPTGAAR
jgi:hypothetical protein